MNRSINILLGVLLFPTMALTIFVGFDLPIEMIKLSGNNLPYKDYIFLGLGMLILIVIIRRSIRRWMGMRIVNQVKKFKWNAEVSKERKSRVRVYLLLEALVMTFVGVALYEVCETALPAGIAFLIGALDSIIFAIAGRNGKYRVGISSKAVIVADREVILLYFTGLRKISAHQQTTYFDYIKGLQLSFPTDCIQEEEREEFLEVLEQQIDPNRVFFSKTMGNS
ncbi:MAG: hypothetical protein P8P74_04410 [Crocinitomicaceae bacterium]|nr:hypothetical protein [Crocinitomicaceae bacterium]